MSSPSAIPRSRPLTSGESRVKLRIIAGSHGGRFIEAPRGRQTRPTAARVREAWFSALGDTVFEARMADLYAGSGALGLEALSRGAAHVHFVESNRRAAEFLDRNLTALGLEDRGTIVRADATTWVDRLAVPLDIVLADPPYESDDGARLLKRFRERPFAAQFWIEHDAASDLADGARWTRRYGDTRISSFRSTPERDGTTS